MDRLKIWNVYFSPSGTTQRIVERISCSFSEDKQTINLLKNLETKITKFGSEDLLIVGLPVFSGRIPGICMDYLKTIEGAQTPVIATIVYGNRDYEDALLELIEILEQQNFKILGAGAFIGQHSIFPKVGEGRPDEEDLLKVDEFTAECQKKLHIHSRSQHTKIEDIKGSHPYKKIKSIPIKPTADKNCMGCGKCVEICPVGAIDLSDPKDTEEKCIRCTACISICPVQSRNFHGIIYRVAAKKFQYENSKKKFPEYFL